MKYDEFREDLRDRVSLLIYEEAAMNAQCTLSLIERMQQDNKMSEEILNIIIHHLHMRIARAPEAALEAKIAIHRQLSKIVLPENQQ